MKRRILQYKLPLLFLFSFLIRLIHLDQSLWLDEATTAVAVKTHSFWNIVTQFSPTDFHPPLYYLVMKVWTGIFGYSEVALRMPSVLFSLGAGWMVYKIGKIISESRNGVRDDKDRNLAFWATAFFLFNPLIIYYSQEARMYAMVTFTIAVSFYYFLNVIHANDKKIITKHFWIMNIFFIVSFYSFYASAFYIGSVWVYLLILKRYKIFLLSISVFILPLLLITPLLYEQLLNSRVALEQVTNWSMVLGNVSLKNLALIPLKLTSGRISFYPKMLYYALAGGWLGLVSLPLIKLRLRTSEVSKKYYFFLVMPLLLGVIFSFNSPMLQYFRFQYLIIFLSLLLAYGVRSLDTMFSHLSGVPSVHFVHGSRIVRKMASLLAKEHYVSAFLLIGFVSWSLLYLLHPQFHREDWRSLSKALQHEKAPIYMILSSSDPLKYYAPEVEVKDLRSLTNQEKSILVIPYTADIHGVAYKEDLLKMNYVHVSSYSVSELQYERWQKDNEPNE